MPDALNILDFNMQMRMKLFAASGSFVVPSGVNWLWLDGCGGGEGHGAANHSESHLR